MEKNQKTRVVVTDDHKMVRQGLKLLLKGDNDIEVIGEAESGEDLLELLKTVSPEVVLMDINMAGMNGLETTRQLKELYPDVKVIALSMMQQEPFVQKMIEAGAMGYIFKNSGKDELTTAIKLVNKGIPYMCSSLSMNLLENRVRLGTPRTTEEPTELSKRELEVLSLIAEGYTNAEISDKLFTSKRTIETHRQNILEKTAAKNTAHLIKYAIENGLIQVNMKR